ncbi:MAG: hypothetical protein PHQ43_12650, partial [Dehalococcoidales bacterium]|nr:hypothetical protein [Dehalococcoidales bacterium]
YNHLTLTPAGTTTYSLLGDLTGANVIAGNLTINANATLDTNSKNLTISGATTVNGELDISAATADSTLTLTGSLTNNGVVKINDATHTASIVGATGSTRWFNGTDIDYNGKTVTLANLGYNTAVQLGNNEAIILGGNCSFKTITLNGSGAAFTTNGYNMTTEEIYNYLGTITISSGGYINTGTYTFYNASNVSSYGMVYCRNFTTTGAYTNYTGSQINSSGNVTISGTFVNPTNNYLMISGASKTINASVTIGNLQIFDGASATVSTNALEVGGYLTIGSGTSGAFDAGGRAVTVTGLTTVSSGSTYSASTALQTFNGGLTISGGTFTCGAAGSVDVNGAFALSSGTFTQATSTLNVSGNFTIASGTTFTKGGTITFDGTGNLTDNSATKQDLGNVVIGGATATRTLTTAVTLVNLTVNSGNTFNPSSYLVTGSGTLDVTGTIKVGASTFAENYTGFTTRTLNSGSTVIYARNAEQTIDNTLLYANLILLGRNTKVLGGNTTITGDLTVQTITFGDITLNPNTYTITGSGTNTLTVLSYDSAAVLLVDATTFTGNYASFETVDVGSGRVNYSRSGDQAIDSSLLYGDLYISGSGTKTLGGATTVGMYFAVDAGAIFSPGGYAITGSGSYSMVVTGTILVDASTFAGNYVSFAGKTFNAGSTVNYSGTTQTIDNTLAYANLTTSGSGTKTLGGATTITGNLTVGTGTTLDSSSYSVTGTGTNTLDVTGTVKVGASTFAGSYASFETITLNAGSTVNYSAAGDQTIDNALSYKNLITSGSGIKTLGGATDVSEDLTVNSGTTLAGASTLTLSGAGKYIYGSGTISAPVTISANHTIDATANITMGTITVSGMAPVITNNGTATVSSIIDNTALHSTWTQGSNSTLNYSGSNLPGSLGATASGNTVNYNGSGAQSVTLTSYYHLKLSGSGVKTMTGITAIAGDLTIQDSATMTSNAAFTVTGAFNYASSGSTTLAASTNISIGSFNQTAGTLIDNGNTITVTGTGANTWVKSGTFTATGTVKFTGAAPQIGASNFYNLTMDLTSGTATLAGNITVTGAYTNTTGTFDANTKTVTVTGLASINGGTYLASTGQQTFNGGLTVAGGTFNASSASAVI